MKSFDDWVNDMSTDGWNEEDTTPDIKIVHPGGGVSGITLKSYDNDADKALASGASDCRSDLPNGGFIPKGISWNENENRNGLYKVTNLPALICFGGGGVYSVSITDELREQIIKEYKVKVIKEALALDDNLNLHISNLGLIFTGFKSWDEFESDPRSSEEILKQWLEDNK